MKSIVKIINDHLLATMLKCSDAFTGSRMFDVADNAYKEMPSGATYAMPCVFENDGRVQYVGIDDVNPWMSYHRIIGITFAPSDQKSFGDQRTAAMVASMRMAIYTDRSRIPMSNDELAMFVMSNFPTMIKQIPNFGNVVVRVTSIVTNNLAAFRNEYESQPYFLKPEHTLINVNYQIESIVNPACFNFCTL